MGTSTYVIGGVCITVCICAIVAYIKSKPILDPNVCLVDELRPSTIVDWFKKNNKEGRYTNMVILPDHKNLERFHISHLISNTTDHSVLQVLFDEQSQKVKSLRVVHYNTVQTNFAKMLEQTNGIIIME